MKLPTIGAAITATELTAAKWSAPPPWNPTRECPLCTLSCDHSMDGYGSDWDACEICPVVTVMGQTCVDGALEYTDEDTPSITTRHHVLTCLALMLTILEDHRGRV